MIISSNNTILLRCVWDSSLHLDAMGCAKVMKIIFDILTSIIYTKSLNLMPSLFFNKFFEVNKIVKYFTFVFEKVDPSSSKKVINESKCTLSP